MQNIRDLFPSEADVSKDLLRKSLVGPVVNAQGFGALGDGITDDRDALATAAAQVGGMTILVPSGRYRIGSNLAFGPQVNLSFLPGATLIPDAGVIIEIKGVLDAGAYAIFDLSANGSFVRGEMKVPYVLPQWFGAVTEDRTAATRNVRAFAAAWRTFNTLHGMMVIPPGVYFVDDTVKFSDVIDGKNHGYYGPRIIGSGLIHALETANFAGKAVVHIEGVEMAANALCVAAATTESSNSPAVGLAVTRAPNHRGGGINGNINVSGAYTHASYYNVSCENCNIQNSTIRNTGNGAVIWDGPDDLTGLTLARKGDSNTRKSFLGCNIMSHSGKPTTLVKMGWIAEFSFTNCYFFMDSGNVFSDADQGAEVGGLVIRECRCEVNLNQLDEIKDANKFVDIHHGLVASEITYVNFESPGAMVSVDGGRIGSLHLIGNKITGGTKKPVRELKVVNSGFVEDLTGFPRYPIEIMNGRGASRLTRIDISSMVDPPIIGDGNYSLSDSNRYLSRAGMVEKGPPRAQGELQNLVNNAAGERAFRVGKSTAFYVTGKTRIAWLSDTFTTHLITIVCADGNLAIEHDAPRPPDGFKSVQLAGGKAFEAGRGAIIVLQNSYGGWREISRVAQERGAIDWQPGGIPGLAPGAGDTSPPVSLAAANFGDFVRVAPPYDLKGAIHSAYIVGPGEARIRIQNLTPSHLAFPSGIWSLAVDK